MNRISLILLTFLLSMISFQSLLYCKDPIKDLKKVKDEVRDKYGKDDMKNCMHSSDSKENVEREADICFKINNELKKIL